MSDLDCFKFLLTNFPRQSAKFINSDRHYHRKRYAYFLCTCIYLLSLTVTYRSDGPGVYYYILSFVCICKNTCHYNELFTYLLIVHIKKQRPPIKFKKGGGDRKYFGFAVSPTFWSTFVFLLSDI